MLKNKPLVLLVSLVILVLAGSGYNFYRYRVVTTELNDVKNQIASTTQTLKAELAGLKNQNNSLNSDLISERSKSNSFAGQIDTIANTVNTLEKLSRTDKELLQKYSKVYFLNENYIPDVLTVIDTKYLYTKDKPLKIHDRAWPFLRKLLDAAAADNITIQVISAYRSFGTQALLKSDYKVVYGAGTANQFSADQGYSEHQLGTAVDFTTPTIGATFSGFDKSAAYNWLVGNAFRYGFVLSYPKGNVYYQFEPWHWRFVGLELAAKLYGQNKYFYDLDQREIDKYLVNIFNL